MSEQFTVIVKIDVKPGHAQTQIDAYQQIKPLVLAEEGCLQYDLHQDESDENKFVLIEKWASPAALATHDAAPYMLEYDAKTPEFRAKPAEVIKLKNI